jgi:peptide/nickel transport system substrate-binding protein
MLKGALVTLATSLAACVAGSALAQQAPQHGGILEFAVVGEPPTYDCHATNTFAATHRVTPHYSLLVKYDQHDHPNVIGDLAESWTVSDDGLAYTFRLHNGVVFHDGTPFTSADVVASFERLRKPPPGVQSYRAGMFWPIAAIEAPDDLTVVFRIRQTLPYFVQILASPFNCIYSAKLLAANPNAPDKTIMGTGPFVFVEHIAGAHWTGKRFDKYFRPDRPYLDGFKAVSVSGPAVATALQSGQVLAEFRGVSPPVRDRLVQALGDKVTVQESIWNLVLTLAFNVERQPFDDARVRRALNLAIDRWGGAQSLSKLVSLRAVGLTEKPGTPYAPSDEELTRLAGFRRDMEANRAEAQRLLKEAGHEKLAVRLTNRNIPDPYVAAGIYVIDQWRKIGVSAEQDLLDGGPHQAAFTAGTFDVILETASEIVDDPAMQLLKYISADRTSINAARYIDRTLDGLHERILNSTDFGERFKLTRAFEERLTEQSYMLPVLWFHRTVVLSSRVRNWKLPPNNNMNQDLTDVWLAPQ